jgi:hypothetical protein
MAFQATEPDRILINAAVTEIEGSWIVAGEERNVSDTVRAPNAMRVVHEALGEVPPPDQSGILPTPVMGPEGAGWGLVWGKPHAAEGTPVLEGYFPELAYAYWTGQSWSRSIPIAEQLTLVRWRGHASVVRISEGEFATVSVGLSDEGMVLYSEVAGRSAMAVPFGPDVHPLAGTAVMDRFGMLGVVAIVRRRVDGATLQEIVLIQQSIATGRWTAPTVIWETARTPIENVRAIRDEADRLHVLWSTGTDGRIMHIVRNDIGAWEESRRDAGRGVVVKWVAGSDRCGNVALIEQRLNGPQSLDLILSRWDGVWRDGGELALNHVPLFLFDGWSANGDWIVGWSGYERAQPDASSAVWLSRP